MMDEGGAVEKLKLFGLTGQEASIYLCLYKSGMLTGYEAAKLTGISRSNVYGALAGLAEKGAACLEEGSSSRYGALPVEEFCDNKLRLLARAKEWLKDNMPDHDEPNDGYITITGERQIMDKMHHMMEQAEKRVYLSASATRLAMIADDISALLERKIKVVLLSERLPESLSNAVYYMTESRMNQVRLITDSRYVLTGELTGGGKDCCLYTGQRVFVDAMKEAMRNEIRLIELTGKSPAGKTTDGALKKGKKEKQK